MDDTFIKARLKYQDKKVFDLVFTYYYTGLCAFANTIVNDRSAAEDIVQDIFVKFWNDCEVIEISGSLKSYFFSSVRNRSLDYLKHQNVHSKYIEERAFLDSNSTNIPEFTEEEMLKLLEQKIRTLPPRCREIFILSRFEGLKNREIGNKLSISKRTVEIQISNAIRLLKKSLVNK